MRKYASNDVLRHNMTITLINTPQLWLPSQDMYKIGPVNFSSWMAEEFLKLHLSHVLVNHPQPTLMQTNLKFSRAYPTHTRHGSWEGDILRRRVLARSWGMRKDNEE